MSDVLESALRELAGEIRVEPPRESLVEQVVARLEGEPVPRRSSARALADWTRGRRRWLVSLLAGLLAAGLVASPVGATVAEWFGFHGVVVSEGDPAVDGEPVVPSEPDGLSVAEAAGLVGFDLRVPAALGQPDGVSVSADGRVVSMSWDTGDGTIRLDQFDGSLEPTFWKTARDSERVTVLDADGLWFPTPHEVVLLSGDTLQTIAPRLAGQTLIWPRGQVTLRLEGSLSSGEAVRIAQSAG